MGRRTNSGALTESVFYILLLLHKPAHGYALMKDIAEITAGRVNLGAGSLYGAFDSALITLAGASQPVRTGHPSGGGPPHPQYLRAS